MDIWQIIAYFVAVVFNVVLTSQVRRKIADRIQTCVRGRWAIAILYVLSVCWLVVLSRGNALLDADAFVRVLEQAWNMVGASIGLHVSIGAADSVLRSRR